MAIHWLGICLVLSIQIWALLTTWRAWRHDNRAALTRARWWVLLAMAAGLAAFFAAAIPAFEAVANAPAEAKQATLAAALGVASRPALLSVIGGALILLLTGIAEGLLPSQRQEAPRAHHFEPCLVAE